jgi:transcription antitermination factor NusA-like protein
MQLVPRLPTVTRAAAALRLPGIEPASDRPYGARSDEAVLVGDLLARIVPALSRGNLEIVAIARRPGILTKVVVRRSPGTRLTRRPISLLVGVGADYIRRVRDELGGERIHVIQWHADPARYVSEALGLSYVPPIRIDASRRVDVLLGEIDFRGVRGWQSVNLLLTSAVTGWRVRLKRIASSPAWRALEDALYERRSVPADVVALLPKGLSVTVYGLHALLPTGQVQGVRRNTAPQTVEKILHQRLGHEIQVLVLRLDADAGHVFVSERMSAARQLRLPLDVG